MKLNYISKFAVWALASAAISGSSVAHATNILYNGDFELGATSSTIDGNTNSGVPVGWTPNAGFDLVSSFNHLTSANVESGSYALSISNYDYQPLATLSQTFSDVSGANYSVSFWAFDGGANGDANAFLSVAAGSNGVTLNDTYASPYANFTFSFVGSGTDTLTISARTNPSEWYVDNISVNGLSSAVPEPSTWAMMLLGFGGLGFAGYRRNKAATFAA